MDQESMYHMFMQLTFGIVDVTTCHLNVILLKENSLYFFAP